MSDDIAAIVEQQRALAEHQYQAYMADPEFRGADGAHEVNLITLVLYAFLESNGYLESFDFDEYVSLSHFVGVVRDVIERQLVEGVNRENGVLALAVAFGAIREADWYELAAMVRTVLIDRLERHIQFAGTDERLIPRIDTVEVDPNQPYPGG